MDEFLVVPEPNMDEASEHVACGFALGASQRDELKVPFAAKVDVRLNRFASSRRHGSHDCTDRGNSQRDPDARTNRKYIR
jgi:hypothetical protein